ncbi:MAG TPA: transposase, partial [bacterium]|nr:transposase [bacterium]
MTPTDKVALVESVWETHGLNRALQAVGLAKSTWYYHQQHNQAYTEKYAHLQPLVEEIVTVHAEYGVRRIQVELAETYGVQVNHKVLRRVLRVWDLALRRTARSSPPSDVRRIVAEAGPHVNLVRPQETIAVLDVVYTDFTRISYADGTRTAQLMPMIGHRSKVVFGWSLG